MSHGYLPAQFLSRLSNRRGDGYDGSLEARLRFSREVLTAVHDAAGHDGRRRPPVGGRAHARRARPWRSASRSSADWTARAAGLRLARARPLGVPGRLDVDRPSPADARYRHRPAGRRGAGGRARQLPVLATTRVVDLAAADRLVRDGVADLVGMTRALIADPDLIAKAQAGAPTRSSSASAATRPASATTTPGCRSGAPSTPAPAASGRWAPAGRVANAGNRARRVLVIGAGPAGAAAAIEAARAGDQVTLVEREPELGGQLRLAGLAPAHAELWERYHRSTRGRLRAAGVTLQLDTEADARARRRPTTRSCSPPVRDHTSPRCQRPTSPAVQAWDAIRDPDAASGPVLVADWGGGWDGLDAAERLAGAGRAVTLACAATVAGETLHQYQRNLYLSRLDELGIVILHHHELAVDRDARVAPRVLGPQRPLPEVATLVLAQGRVPADELWAQLESHPGARARGRRARAPHARGGGARGYAGRRAGRRAADWPGDTDRRPRRRREPGGAWARGRVRRTRGPTRCRSGKACVTAPSASTELGPSSPPGSPPMAMPRRRPPGAAAFSRPGPGHSTR